MNQNHSINEAGQVVIRHLPKKPFRVRFMKDMKKYWVMYLVFIPVALYFLLFNYIPMYGITIAFKDYSITKGILGSPWVGLEKFQELFVGEDFVNVLRNTAVMAVMNLVMGFLASVIFALILSEVRFKRFKRISQIASYVPHFIATMVVAQLVIEFLNVNGPITQFLTLFGFEAQNWLANADVPVFWLINTFTDTWVGFGYGAIIFLAAITSIDPTLYEAAAIDGANRWHRMRHITIPTIIPVIAVMLTIRVGLIFVVGFDKILLLYKPTTYITADVLYTYTYRLAFGSYIDYSLASASGLFQSLIGTILLIFAYGLRAKLQKREG